MTEFDRRKFPPPEDEAMLPWYRGIFDCGFIALHPFFVIEGLDPRLTEHGTLVLEGTDRPAGADFIKWMDQLSAEHSKGKELHGRSVDHMAKRFGQTIGWGEMCERLGLEDHCELDAALRTHIKGLRDDLTDPEAADRMVRHCAANRIFLRIEGDIPPLFEARLAAMFRRAGFTEIIAGDEFGDDECIVPVIGLDNEEPWITRDDFPTFGHLRLMAPDHSMLAWVHWDSFYTAIFATKERAASLELDTTFESFWCAEETKTFWLTQRPLPLVQPR